MELVQILLSWLDFAIPDEPDLKKLDMPNQAAEVHTKYEEYRRLAILQSKSLTLSLGLWWESRKEAEGDSA